MSYRRTGLVLLASASLAALCACKSSTQPVPAEHATASPEQAPSAEALPRAAGASAVPQSVHRHEDLLQRVLDAPSLQGFYHPNVGAERLPVRLLLSSASNRLGHERPMALVKFGQAVELVAAGEPRPAAFFEVVSLDVDADKGTAVVVLRYDIEGVEASFELARGPEGYSITTQRVVER